MKNIILLGLIIILCSCGDKPSVKTKSAPEELIETDKQFSKMSAEKGIKEAFVFYASDDVIKLQNKQFPVMGKEALKKMYEEEEQGIPPLLTWEPVKAEMASSGDLGYTFGNWKMIIRDSSNADTFYGNYISVWKKMADGLWKYVLDAGSSTPKPGENP